MAHQCSCSHKALSPVPAEQTVGDVVRDDAGALEVMKKLGINRYRFACGCPAMAVSAEASASVNSIGLTLSPAANF